MSTRCLTKILDLDGSEICTLCRHWDGYPNGHGADLKRFLKGKKLVNGYSGKDKEGVTCFNGMGRAASAIVAHFYPEHGIEIFPPGTKDIWEEWIYEVRGLEGEELTVKAKQAGVGLIGD